MIRKATINDINEIMAIVEFTKGEMHKYNNYQWDENYPKSGDFEKDILKGTLYIWEENSRVAGFVCIDDLEPEEYVGKNWAINEKALVVHRVAVSKDFRKKGLGIKLIKYAEDLAKENKVRYLKTDTYSLNLGAQSLFKKCQYKFVDQMDYLGKEKTFYLFEKIL